KEGLDSGEAIIYISDKEHGRHKREFENFGIDISVRNGLRIVDVEDWYLDPVSLNREKMIKKWAKAVHLAKESGFKKTRIIGESSYFFENDMMDQLMSYESSLPKSFPFPITAICRYKNSDVASHDDGRLLIELLKIHSNVVTPSIVEEINFPEYYLESINDTLGCIFGEETRQTLLYHIETEYALSRSEIPVKLRDFFKVLESLLGTGGMLVDQAILKNLYNKIGLRYDYKQ
ncbi:MAG: MEDS domain-containing protein, partial [Candidatus Bathyarchaeota archaeon]